MSKKETYEIKETQVYPENDSPTSQFAPLPQWPTEPASLDLAAAAEKALDVFDIAVISTTVALLVKAILCVVAHRVNEGYEGAIIDQIAPWTLYLISLNTQLTTLFTVIFSLIIGTLFSRLALYRAQEGSATVAELEQFQASRSLPSALHAIWSLRSFGPLSVCLIICWSWYYLGSQATTHEYGLSLSTSHSIFPIAYPSPYAQSAFAQEASINDVVQSNINSQFVLQSQFFEAGTMSGGADSSGNLLVPLWGYRILGQSVDQYTSPTTNHGWFSGWFDTKETSEIQYTSAIGLPLYSMSDVNGFGGVGFLIGYTLINTTYFNVTCGLPSLHHAKDFPKGVHSDAAVSINMTEMPLATTIDYVPPAATFDVWLRENFTGPTMMFPCQVNTVHVELLVHCTGPSCVAQEARLVMEEELVINRTPFDDHDFGNTFFSNLLLSNGIPSYTPERADSYATSYVTGSFEEMIGALWDYPSFGDISGSFGMYATELTLTMTQLINTYYRASLLAVLVENGRSPDEETDPWQSIIVGNTTSPDWNTALFVGSHYNPHYELSVAWVTIDIISCVFLFACAVWSMVLRKKTFAPDIFGFVSSLTRDHPELPNGGSALSGFDRARLMKHVKIKIADVSDDPEVGKVGLKHAGYVVPKRGGAQEHEAIEVTPLKRDRRYL